MTNPSLSSTVPPSLLPSLSSFIFLSCSSTILSFLSILQLLASMAFLGNYLQPQIYVPNNVSQRSSLGPLDSCNSLLLLLPACLTLDLTVLPVLLPVAVRPQSCQTLHNSSVGSACVFGSRFLVLILPCSLFNFLSFSFLSTSLNASLTFGKLRISSNFFVIVVFTYVCRCGTTVLLTLP